MVRNRVPVVTDHLLDRLPEKCECILQPYQAAIFVNRKVPGQKDRMVGFECTQNALSVISFVHFALEPSLSSASYTSRLIDSDVASDSGP
jgi:hypothetical protein